MRGRFFLTAVDADGDVQASKSVNVYEPGTAGATPLAQNVYDAASGGSLVASPQTNSAGQLRLYADLGQYIDYRVNGGALQQGRIDPDPAQIVTLAGTQVMTGGKTILGPFAARGLGVNTPGQGIELYADGTLGISDGTFPNKSAYNLIEIIKSSTSNFNMIDIFHYVENQGTLHSSHTATSTGASTVAVGSGPWFDAPDPSTYKEANQVGRFVKITQAGLTQVPKQIVSNSSTVLTVSPAFSPSLTGNPTFEIIDAGDQAMFRTITDIRNPSSGYTVAGGYNFESTIQLQSGVARTGAINFLGRIAVYEEWTDTVRNVIFWAQTTAGGFSPAPGGRPRANIAFYSSGTGVISHFRADDFNGTIVYNVEEAGYVRAVRGGFGIGTNDSSNPLSVQAVAGTDLFAVTTAGYASAVRGRFGGSLTTGGLGSSTASVAIRTTAASLAGGFQLYRSGSSDTFTSQYFDSNDNAYLQNSPGGAAGGYLQMGGANSLPAFWFNAMSGQAADLARWGVTGSNLASISVAGGWSFAANEVQTGVISPTQLAANTDDWNPTGLATARVIRATTDASRNLTGITAQASGTRISIVNAGAQNLVLVHDATSTAANRFTLPGATNLTLTPGSAAEIWYDATSTRWRKVA